MASSSRNHSTNNSKGAWLMPHQFGFTEFINKKFEKFKLQPQDPNYDPCMCMKCSKAKKECGCRDEFELFPYQKFIGEYLNTKTPYRGLLLYHGLGSGKTISAIATAEGFKHERKVVVLLPASLKENFIGEILKFGTYDIVAPSTKHQIIEVNGKRIRAKSKLSDSDAEKLKSDAQRALIAERYKFYSYNASNFMSQFKHEDLDNKVLIVDEVHNLISMIVGNGKQGDSIYKKIMSAQNLRIILLSGTPMINTPFESSVIFNILRGYINEKFEEWKPGDGAKHTLFPENVESFYEQYIDETDPSFNKLKNKEEFTKRIFGLVSYYAGLQGKNVYPDVIIKPNVLVPMSPYQFVEYSRVRDVEAAKERSSGIRVKMTRVLNTTDAEEDKSSSIFRIFSRQVSNYAFPSSIQRPYPSSFKDSEGNSLNNGRTYQKKINDAIRNLERNRDEFLSMSALESHSPKMLAIINNINKGCPGYEDSDLNSFKKGNVVVYSFFKSVEGIKIFSMALEEAGYADYRDTSISPVVPRYAVFNGKDDYDILKVYNSPENKDGFIIKILLISSSGAEGISLYNVRQVHIMEPYWNEVQIRQVIGRAKRICSHYDLPPEQRNITVYRYLSVFNDEQRSSSKESTTTDEFIYTISLNKERIIQEIQQLMKETAVDCSLNHAHNIADPANKGLRCRSFIVPTSTSSREMATFALKKNSPKLKRKMQSPPKKETQLVRGVTVKYMKVRALNGSSPIDVYIPLESKDKFDRNAIYEAYSTTSVDEGNPTMIGKVSMNKATGKLEFSVKRS